MTKTKALAKKEEKTPTKLEQKAAILETKQQTAYELKLRGYKLEGIAAVLGVTTRTVKNYIRNFKDRMGTHIVPANAKELIGDSMLAYENIEKEAWQEWVDAKGNPAARAKFLDLARVSRNDRIKLLKDLGVIAPPTTTEVVEEYEEIVKDELNKIPEEVRRLVRRAVITRTYTGPAISEPEPDPTFASVIPDEDEDDDDIIEAQFEKDSDD